MSTEIKPFAFVLMPFTTDFHDIYQFGIKQACAEAGIIAERVDEQIFSETILERIYRQIDNSDFVIADMTNQNPNVFYEVGYAHAKGKICLMATQSVTDIPFDLKHHPHIVYDGSASDFKVKIKSSLEWAKAETAKRKSQTIALSAKAIEATLTKKDYIHEGSFDLQIDLHNKSSMRSPEIEAIYLKVLKVWTISAHGKECPIQLDEDGKSKRVVLKPSIRRLAPGAFSQERFTLSRTFWSKWNGHEQKESYKSKGSVKLEVATSEGTLSFDLPVEVTFEEFPF